MRPLFCSFSFTIIKRILIKNSKIKCGEKNIVSRSLKTMKAQSFVPTTLTEIAEYCKLKPPAEVPLDSPVATIFSSIAPSCPSQNVYLDSRPDKNRSSSVMCNLPLYIPHPAVNLVYRLSKRANPVLTSRH